MQNKSKTIKLFFDEKLQGIQTIWLDNWIGQIYLGNRNHVKLLTNIPELNNCTAFYFLLTKEKTDEPANLYIGETEDIIKRLKSNLAEKDWWENFIVFTSLNNSITKAHVKYLERKFFYLASQNLTTVNLRNDNKPNGATLPHSDLAYMSNFMEETIFILKSLNIIDFTTTVEISGEYDYKNIFYINIEKKLDAKLAVEGNKYILLKGSYIRPTIQQSFKDNSYNQLRGKLEKENKLVEDANNNIYVTEDIVFKSSSASASIVLGRAANGKIEWKTHEGKFLKEFEAEKELENLNKIC